MTLEPLSQYASFWLGFFFVTDKKKTVYDISITMIPIFNTFHKSYCVEMKFMEVKMYKGIIKLDFK